MGFRFWRRMKILPGVTLNISKSGASLSFGVRGAKYTVGPKGTRTTFGIPGTGLFYTKTHSKKKQSAKTEQDANDNLTMGFFKQLITPDNEKALVNGCRELVAGNEEKAFEYFKQAVHIADGAYLAGFLALKNQQYDKAVEYLETALKNNENLGSYLSKYGIVPTLTLSITVEISIDVGIDVKGALLGLVEAYQATKRFDSAVFYLKELLKIAPDDVVVKLSLAELLLNAKPNDKETLQTIVELAEGVENETYIHSALLFYKAKALHRLGLEEAAAKTLTTALRRKKGRPEDLLKAIRYERALIYEKLGQHKRSQNELEKLYADDPDYKDVAEKLGLKS